MACIEIFAKFMALLLNGQGQVNKFLQTRKMPENFAILFSRNYGYNTTNQTNTYLQT